MIAVPTVTRRAACRRMSSISDATAGEAPPTEFETTFVEQSYQPSLGRDRSGRGDGLHRMFDDLNDLRLPSPISVAESQIVGDAKR